MGGGQDSASPAHLNTWDLRWESDAEEEGDGSDDAENLVVVDSNGGVSSECEPEREAVEEEEVQGSELSRLTSPTPSFFAEDSAHWDLRRRILQNRKSLATRDNVRQTRSKLKWYTPGSSIFYAEGKKGSETAIPHVTTVLIVGFQGAGKSTLINNVIRVLHNRPTGFYRAQVSDDPSENGTYFMGEYMICGGSGRPRVSLFDTRGLSEDDTSEGMALLEGWMKDGVRHGQMDLRASDSSSTKESLETRGRHHDHHFSKKRNVNSVIFVINAVSVFKMKESGDEKKRIQLVQLYKNPYLTFKDDRPVVVMTHGDKLSDDDRISTQMYLGEILGVPPVEQIFDISGTTMLSDVPEGTTGTTMNNMIGGIKATTVRDITILDMLSFALDCADRNLPYKQSSVASLKEIWVAKHLDLMRAHFSSKRLVFANFARVLKSMAMDYRALDHSQKVALFGVIICVYILLILFVTAGISLSLMLKKRKWSNRHGGW